MGHLYIYIYIKHIYIYVYINMYLNKTRFQKFCKWENMGFEIGWSPVWAKKTATFRDRVTTVLRQGANV